MVKPEVCQLLDISQLPGDHFSGLMTDSAEPKETIEDYLLPLPLFFDTALESFDLSKTIVSSVRFDGLGG